MGTGPWPQPPTEAEQLQALMAAANGESCTPSFSSSSFSITSFAFQNNFSLFTSVTRACVGRLDVWLPVGGQPTRSLTCCLCPILIFPCRGCPEEASDHIQAAAPQTNSTADVLN